MRSYLTKLNGKTYHIQNPDNLLLTPVEYELIAAWVQKTEEKMEVASQMAGLKTSDRLLVVIEAEAVARDKHGDIIEDSLTIDIQYVPPVDEDTFADNIGVINGGN